jgi:hypothetical protein
MAPNSTPEELSCVMGYNSRSFKEPDVPEPTAREKAMADPAVPAALKDLAERILPQRLEGELRRSVAAGVIDPLKICDAQPLLSPVSQVMGLPLEETSAWLKILFSTDPVKMMHATCPCTGFRYGRFSTDLDNRDPYYGTDVETPSLLSVLASRTQTPIVDIAKILPAALSMPVADIYGNNAIEPLLNQLPDSREFSIETFDKLEEAYGSPDFLLIKNSRGETLFHRIAAHTASAEDQLRLDVASWMLQRRPELVNESDRFGWTPLDRMLSQARGKIDTSMGRLLIVSGAKLAKQIAPPFNLAAALDEHGGSRLDKPAPRKPGQLPKLS